MFDIEDVCDTFLRDKIFIYTHILQIRMLLKFFKCFKELKIMYFHLQANRQLLESTQNIKSNQKVSIYRNSTPPPNFCQSTSLRLSVCITCPID